VNLRPAVFFDRDGVVNESPGAGYVLRWEDFQFSPGILPALRLCKERGYATILVTSQQGVGKGLMSMADLDHIHGEMQRALAAEAAAFDGIYACTCLASDPDCHCRKPSAEMILRAAAEHQLDLTRSLLVGDYDRDIQMAHNAGLPLTVRVLAEGHPASVPATVTLASTFGLAEALAPLLVPNGV
jgi:D-glycero-D-manno-heptose 1,7-bisphosphate phosphatase